MAEQSHTPGPWHWVNPETDEPRQAGEWRSSLRTVHCFGEDRVDVIEGKSYTRFSLPKFILEADEIRDDAMEANARLIAAAPDLLEALDAEKLDIVADDIEANGHYVWARSLREMAISQRAAIAKATGGSNEGRD